MKIFKTLKSFQNFRKTLDLHTIGFVPTMGALHKGHLSLIKKSKAKCTFSIVSIFVNPAQFSPSEDFKKYPRLLNMDIKELKKINIDALFLPNKDIMFPKTFSFNIRGNEITKCYEGKARPYFFDGVTTIITKLFNIIQPTHAFFGCKDIQQLIIIEKLVEDLNYNIKILSGKTIRNKLGVALSSRNQYLSDAQLIEASKIYQSLKDVKKIIDSGSVDIQYLKNYLTKRLKKIKSSKVEYVSIAKQSNLKEIPDVIQKPAILSVAVWIKNTRLIDNIIIK